MKTFNKFLQIMTINLLLVTSMYAAFSVTKNSQTVRGKSNLHILTVSINNYKNSKFNLQYCNSDAEAMIQSFKQNSKKTFKSILTYSLMDKEVTKENFKLIINKISKNIASNDTFILYVTGHAMVDKDKFYFLTYHSTNYKKNAIDEKTFTDALSSISTMHSLLLIDTSYSGTLLQNISEKINMNMITASKANQVTTDASNKKYGFFMYVLLEAMKDKKSYGYDNKLSVYEIAEYIKHFLPKTTMQLIKYKQEPMIYFNGNIDSIIAETDVKKEFNNQKNIVQKAISKTLLTQSLMQREKDNFLEFKHLLAQAIETDGSKDAKIMYLNSSIVTGELKDYRFIPSNSKIPEGYAKLDKKRYSYEDRSIESNGSLIEHTISIFDNDKNKSVYLWKVLATEILEVELLEDNKIIINYRKDNNNTDALYNSKIKVLDIASQKELDLTKTLNQYILDNIKKFTRFDYSWYEINQTVNLEKFDVYGEDYDINGYSISVNPPIDSNSTTIQIEKYINDKIESSYFLKGYSIGTNPSYPIIIPELDVIILSGVSVNNGNHGAEIIIDKMQKNGSSDYQKVVYENKHHLKGIFLSKNKKYAISHTLNQINITRILKDKAYMTEINSYVDGVSYLKDNIIAYWHGNKITLVEVFDGTYRTIGMLYNLIPVSEVFMKNDNLIVLGDYNYNLTPDDEEWIKDKNKTLAKWDIHQVFNTYKEEKKSGIKAIFYELQENNSLGSDYTINNIDINFSRDGVQVSGDRLDYSLEHNLLHHEVGGMYEDEHISATLSPDMKKLLSLSCYSYVNAKMVEDPCFCKLYLSNMITKTHLIKIKNMCITKTGFLEKDDGIYVEYNDETSIYKTNNVKNLKDKLYSLKTIVDTATEYVNEELKLLTPVEWQKRKNEYKKLN